MAAVAQISARQLLLLDLKLEKVNNWDATSATNDPSSTTYATAAAVKAAYDLAAAALPATSLPSSSPKWTTARKVTLTGDATGNFTIDGSADVSFATTLANSGVTAGTYRSVTVNAKGLITAGTNPTTLAGYGITDAVSSTGTAAKATVLATGRTISATGDATGSTLAFDGSANVSMALTLANSGVTAGTYPKVTVNAKGLVTAGAALAAADIPALDWAKIATGRPTTLAGYGITDAVSSTNGQAPSAMAADKWTTARTVTLTGDVTGSFALDGSGNVSFATTYKNSGVTAGTYRSVTVDAKGNVTAGTNPTTLAGYGITDALKSDATAVSATKLATARAITLSGDATGTANFDGTADAAITLTLANTAVTAGTYKSVTVDGKGRVTAGTNPTTLAGYGISDAVNSSTGTAPKATVLATARNFTIGIAAAKAFDGSAALSWSLADIGAYAAAGGGIAGDFWRASGTNQFGLVDSLGSTTNAMPSLILLSKKYVGTALAKSGFVGRIFFNRGAAAAGMQTDFVDVSVSGAYTTNINRLLYRSGGTVAAAKIVEVTYNSEVYFALYRPATNNAEVVVTGHAFDATLPLLIADATAYTVTDVVTTEESYHTSNKPVKADVGLSLVDNAQQMRAENINGYWGLVGAGGSNSAYLRTTVSGILPHSSNVAGVSNIGTSTWPFLTAYVKTYYEDGVSLAAKYLALAGGTMTGALDIQGTSQQLKITDTATSNKKWSIEVNAGNLKFTEIGVATRLTISPTEITSGLPVVIGGSGSIIGARSAMILRDHNNGNVTLSAGLQSDGTTKGDLYLGYNGTIGSYTANTANVRLESPLTWKGTIPLIDANGVVLGAAKLNTARTLTIGSTGKTFDGSANVAWTVAEIGAAPVGHVGAGGTEHAVATTTVAGFMSGADKLKLDGIASSANNYSHPTGDGNLHVPANGTTNSGKALVATATAGSVAWTTLTAAHISDLSGEATAATANTLALRDASADISARLFKSNYADQTTISGAMAFRVNNSSDNYVRYCSDKAAIRAYLDVAAMPDTPYKVSVSCATAAALTATYANGTSGVGATLTNSGTLAALTVDGYAVTAGERVLIKDQAATAQNGIYVVTNAGSASVAWVLTRSADADTNLDLAAAVVAVDKGTVNGSKLFTNLTKSVDTIGTTAVVWYEVAMYGAAPAASKALVSDAGGRITSSAASATEVGYLAGVTSAIQTQINAKQATITGAATTVVTSNLTASKALVSDVNGKIAASAVTSTEMDYLAGVTSDIQTQLNAKLASTANAVSASKWAAARTITLAGDCTGSVSIDGSANVTLTVAVGDDSHNHTTANIDGLDTALAGKLATTGTAAAATKLATARAITLTGDATGTANFDGTAAISIVTTISGTGHTHTAAQSNSDIVASSYGQIGTYGIFYFNPGGSSSYNVGQTFAGSYLFWSSCNGSYSTGTSPAGTWKLLGSLSGSSGGAIASLWIRIA